MVRRLALGVLVLVACGDPPTPTDSKADKKTAAVSATPTTKAIPPPASTISPPADAVHGALGHGGEERSSGPTLAEPEALKRAGAPAGTDAKGAKSLGFKTSKLGMLYALEGGIAAPDWGRRGKKPLAVRDDNLDTAWTCELIDEAPCALGIVFDDDAAVSALRVYSAAGPKYSDYEAHPRLAKVRIHGDHGYFDVDLDDGAGHRYIIFEPEIEAKSLTVEVLDVHGKGKEIHLAELEVYGTAGRPRPPLQIDPAAVFARYDTTPWKEADRNTIRQVFLEEALAEGKTRRMFRGTAMLGKKDDRFLLVEKLFDTDCTAHDGRYLLVDQMSRLVLPLGQLTGAPRPILRHAEGLGFSSVAGPSDDPFAFTSVVYDEGRIKQRKPSARQKTSTADELRAQWGFTDPAPLGRGGGSRLEQRPDGCTVADPERVSKSKIASRVSGKVSPESVVECKVDGAHALLAQADDCGKSWAIVVLGADGTVVADAKSDRKSPGRGLRLARLGAAELVVETTSKEGARGTLHRITSTGVEVLAEAASFATRIPVKCDPCDDRFAKPPEVPAEETPPPEESPPKPSPAQPDPSEG